MNFSIIICTHNPNLQLFVKLLTAIKSFDRRGIDFEVIIVDNCSIPSINTHHFIQEFISTVTNVHILSETRLGLTYSRITGLNQAKYDWIILFDDDNEPAKDYLIEASSLINQYPKIAAWGPGFLSVHYESIIENSFLKKIKWLFQERKYNGIYFDNNIIEGSPYYPYGTGMILKKLCFDNYANAVCNGLLTMSDRKGESLFSAGDTQILYTCLKMGYYAGSSHTLKLTHIIESKKVTKRYVVQLVYALNSSQLKAYHEVFLTSSNSRFFLTNALVLKILLSSLYTYRAYRRTHTFMMYLSKRMGELNARVIAYNLRQPFILRKFESFFINE